MIAFEVSLNGKRVCLAGIGDDGVLGASVTAILPPEEVPTPIWFNVGGLANDEHVTWVESSSHPRKALEVGDLVQIRIIESETADEPIRRWADKTVETQDGEAV
jgi:hypothetical protein